MAETDKEKILNETLFVASSDENAKNDFKASGLKLPDKDLDRNIRNANEDKRKLADKLGGLLLAYEAAQEALRPYTNNSSEVFSFESTRIPSPEEDKAWRDSDNTKAALMESISKTLKNQGVTEPSDNSKPHSLQYNEAMDLVRAAETVADKRFSNGGIDLDDSMKDMNFTPLRHHKPEDKGKFSTPRKS